MRDNQQSNLEQIELLEVAAVADVPTNPCLGSAVQLNHIDLEAIHAPSQPLHGPSVDINQNTTASDNSLAPEFPRIDIANTAPEPSARIHEMMPFEDIFPSNFLFHNRREVSASAVQDNHGRRAWLVAGALVAAFGLGWACGSNSYRSFNLNAALNPLPPKVNSSRRIPDPERKSVARIDGVVRSTSSEAGLRAPNILKLSSPATGMPGQAQKPLVGASQLDAASSSAMPVEQANASLPGAMATRREAMAKPAPETRPTTIEGWTVRDVQGGTAVLEGPDGVWTATRGDTVPGVGRIDSIVRWGSRWIVATASGLIATP